MTGELSYTQNRELSWLTFNERVLAEGGDARVPLFERLKFASIFTSNLDEFYMIRVGGLHDLTLLKKHIVDNKTGMTPQEQLEAIFTRCRKLYKQRDAIFNDIESRLRDHGVCRHVWESLDDDERKRVEEYAEDFVLPILSPQVVDPLHPFPHFANLALYVTVRLEPKPTEPDTTSVGKVKTPRKKSTADTTLPRLGIIPIPHILPRTFPLSDTDVSFILVEEIIAHYAAQIFSMYNVAECVVLSVTRNADINPDDETYDDDDYRLHMKKILKKRTRLAPVRLETQGHLSNGMRDYLCSHLGIEKNQVFAFDSPVDLSYVYGLENRLSDELAHTILYAPFTPQSSPNIDLDRPIAAQIEEGDLLLSYPYESMEPFLQLVREASLDPDVVSIKITLYRLSATSRLAEYLIAAAENGKEVVTLLELRARFDEAANIAWAERFEEAGCTVLYGFEGFKVHSKICLITRSDGKSVSYITQLATGNYNEKTATGYADLSLISAREDFGREAVNFFRNMTTGNLDGEYALFAVSPVSFKPFILEGIEAEIAKAEAGNGGRIIFKMNSLTDLDIINKLAQASQAGVEIDLIIRGICCIVPGIEGLTDHITVTSVVGRMLEHARIYCFGEGEERTVFLASADLMTRNTTRRVEIAFPLLDGKARMRVIDMLDLQLSDTAKARRMQPDGTYALIDIPDGSDALDAQMVLMQEAAQRAHDAAERRAQEERGAEMIDRMKAEMESLDEGFLAHLSTNVKRFFKRLFKRGQHGGKEGLGYPALTEAATTSEPAQTPEFAESEHIAEAPEPARASEPSEPARVPGQAPEQATEHMPEQTSGQAPEQTSGTSKAPVDASKQAAAETGGYESR